MRVIDLPTPVQAVVQVSFLPNGQVAAVLGDDGQLRFASVAAGTCRSLLDITVQNRVRWGLYWLLLDGEAVAFPHHAMLAWAARGCRRFLTCPSSQLGGTWPRLSATVACCCMMLRQLASSAPCRLEGGLSAPSCCQIEVPHTQPVPPPLPLSLPACATPRSAWVSLAMS